MATMHPFLSSNGDKGFLLGYISDTREDNSYPIFFWKREYETLEKLSDINDENRNKAIIKIDELYETVKTVESEELVEELREIIEKEQESVDK